MNNKESITFERVVHGALRDREHLDRTLTMLTHEREAFFTALDQTKLHVLPSRPHFCLSCRSRKCSASTAEASHV